MRVYSLPPKAWAGPSKPNLFARARTACQLRTESSRSLKSFSRDTGSLTWRARNRPTRLPRGHRQRPAAMAPQAVWPSRFAKCYAAILTWDSEILDGSPPVTAQPPDPPIEHLLRELTPQVLGIVVRRFRDFAASEDAVQEASLAAATQWPRDGMPENPRAWLTQVAFRRMTDHIRAESARRRRESEAALETEQLAPPADAARESEQDDTLILLFMCCHPALTPASAIALTLRAVGGLTTAEIAHAFLVPESTMAQRISRARQSIKDSNIPFQLPTNAERVERLRAVLHVLYLIFNEGYTSSIGSHLRRADLSHEAMRLARIVNHLQPEDTEVAGLLALMLLTDAHRIARTNDEGELIPLAQQDRKLWDRQQIGEGVEIG